MLHRKENKPKKKQPKAQHILTHLNSFPLFCCATDNDIIKKAIFSVRGMTCASCVAIIENYVRTQEGVLEVSVGLLAEKAEVRFDKTKISVSTNPFFFISHFSKIFLFFLAFFREITFLAGKPNQGRH
jgi:copper chaperone CopZ